MEQILKNFFNDNSVCVGLCDLKRKIDNININYAQQTQYQQTNSQNAQQQMQRTVLQQPQQKPQKQTLAQIFAAQQQAYAAQQAYLAQQRQKYAAQTQQQAQQRVVQQKPVYTEAKPLFANQNTNSYIQQMPQKKPQTTVIVNGNMKKVISAAVPPARY